MRIHDTSNGKEPTEPQESLNTIIRLLARLAAKREIERQIEEQGYDR